jgi:hypothetical protein
VSGILDELTSQELQAPARWARELLGERPRAASRAADWDQALQRVTRYRLEHTITDTTDPLGPQPPDRDEAHQWQRAHDAVERVERHLGRERTRDHSIDMSLEP